MEKVMLSFDNVSAHYGKIQALHNVSLHINQGEIVTLIGANGAGKTTLLGTLCGDPRASSGKVVFDGKDITDWQTAKIMREAVAIVPEGRRVFSRMTVEENLAMGGFFADRDQFQSRIKWVYELFPRLLERRIQRAGTMSGGDAVNITAGEARMVAVLRSFSDTARDTAIEEVDRICKGIGFAFGCDIEVKLEEGYALQYNDGAMIDLVEQAVTEELGADKVTHLDRPFSGSEDFSFFGKLTNTPSAFMMIDAGHGEHMVSLHNGKIVFNEEVMKHGVTGLAAIAMEYLNR